VFYQLARVLVGGACRLLFRVRVHHRDRVPTSGVFIVAPSHRSILDIPFMSTITRRRIRFMAKKELFSSRVGRLLFDALGAIQVDRGATDRAALKASQAALDGGELLGIFPEGTRRNGPVLGDLFDGVAYLALKLGVPIVPVGVGGSEEILASGKVLPRLHRVAVVVGNPIVPAPELSARRRADVTKVTEQLRAELQASFDEARSAAGTGPGLVGQRGEGQ
jgi:1-acyl-sn-glycerol-3-phosphate acyltransferase